MDDADLLKRLERTEASLAIQQLPVRYAMAVDSRDLDALAALYVDDVDYEELGRGPEALKKRFSGTLQLFYRSIHQILGHAFEFQDDDHATGRVYCRAEHERGDTWVAVLMCYFDHYERRDGKWYFASKRDYDFFYSADVLDRPQAVDFMRPVVPGMKLNLPMMLPRFPTWKAFWEKREDELISTLTNHPLT